MLSSLLATHEPDIAWAPAGAGATRFIDSLETIGDVPVVGGFPGQGIAIGRDRVLDRLHGLAPLLAYDVNLIGAYDGHRNGVEGASCDLLIRAVGLDGRVRDTAGTGETTIGQEEHQGFLGHLQMGRVELPGAIEASGEYGSGCQSKYRADQCRPVHG
jgi:hypothetical protein